MTVRRQFKTNQKCRNASKT